MFNSSIQVLSIALCLTILTSCSAENKEQTQSIETAHMNVANSSTPALGTGFEKIEYEQMDIDPGNDSLWYHLVMDIPGDLNLAVAQPIDDSNKRGLRMQLISGDENRGFICHAESSPAYDGARLYPTVFGNKAGQHLILADMGVRESWGQKVYLLDNGQFFDMGFIDAGTVVFVENADNGEMELQPQSIGPFVSIVSRPEGTEFSFGEKDIVLFDDGEGNTNVLTDGKKWSYIYDSDGSWKLKKKGS